MNDNDMELEVRHTEVKTVINIAFIKFNFLYKIIIY